jgi:ribonuclease HI
VIERDGETEQYCGTEPQTSNNRMELRGAIAGLRRLAPGSAVALFTTSDYVYQGATRWRHSWKRNGWRKKDGQPVANADLWQELDRLLAKYAVEWVNAKGGREEQGLAEAERLARETLDDF